MGVGIHRARKRVANIVYCASQKAPGKTVKKKGLIVAKAVMPKGKKHRLFFKKDLPKDLNSLVNKLLALRVIRAVGVIATPVVAYYYDKNYPQDFGRGEWSYHHLKPVALAWISNRGAKSIIKKIFENIVTSENTKIKKCVEKYRYFYITHMGRLVFSEKKPTIRSKLYNIKKQREKLEAK